MNDQLYRYDGEWVHGTRHGEGKRERLYSSPLPHPSLSDYEGTWAWNVPTAAVCGQSRIIKSPHHQMIASWIGSVCLEWKLIYRATEDGWASSDFHKSCDEMSNTLSLVSTVKGQLLGTASAPCMLGDWPPPAAPLPAAFSSQAVTASNSDKPAGRRRQSTAAVSSVNNAVSSANNSCAVTGAVGGHVPW